MRAQCLALVVVVFCGCVQLPEGGSRSTGEDVPVAFVDVNVIPMDSERLLENQTVIIIAGRVAAIEPVGAVEIPSNAILVDGAGKYLLPGLAEMHGHIPGLDQPQEFIESVLFMYVANGVTTVRGMLGVEGQLDLKEQSIRSEIIAPNLYLAGPSFNDSSINSPEEAAEKVRLQKLEGWDLLKIHPGLTRDEYDAMAVAANKEGIRFAGHVPAEVGLVHAIEMGQETFDHLDGFIEYLDGEKETLDEDKLAEIVEKARLAGAWMVPTMALWETILGANRLETLEAFYELKYMPRAMVMGWSRRHQLRTSSEDFDLQLARRVADNRILILRALHDGGVPILMGTDAPQQFSVPGFSIHREMPVMSEAGMSPYEIIKSATVNVGRYFQHLDDFGIIAVGQRADLLLVNGNPLNNISNLADRAGVMVRGAWFTKDQIEDRLAHIASEYEEGFK